MPFSTQQQHSAASKILATNEPLDFQMAIHSVTAHVPQSWMPTAATKAESVAPIPLPWNIGSMSSCTVNITYNVQPIPCTANHGQYTATDKQTVPTPRPIKN